MSFSSSSSSSSSSSRVIGTGEVAVVRSVNSSRRGSSSSSSSSISISIDENNNNNIAIQVDPLEGSPAAEQDDAEANNPNHGDDRAALAINSGRVDARRRRYLLLLARRWRDLLLLARRWRDLLLSARRRCDLLLLPPLELLRLAVFFRVKDTVFAGGSLDLSQLLWVCLGVALIAFSVGVECLILRGAVRRAAADGLLERVRRLIALVRLFVVFHAMIY